jgi:hypothetical protein
MFFGRYGSSRATNFNLLRSESLPASEKRLGGLIILRAWFLL